MSEMQICAISVSGSWWSSHVQRPISGPAIRIHQSYVRRKLSGLRISRTPVSSGFNVTLLSVSTCSASPNAVPFARRTESVVSSRKFVFDEHNAVDVVNRNAVRCSTTRSVGFQENFGIGKHDATSSDVIFASKFSRLGFVESGQRHSRRHSVAPNSLERPGSRGRRDVAAERLLHRLVGRGRAGPVDKVVGSAFSVEHHFRQQNVSSSPLVGQGVVVLAVANSSEVKHLSNYHAHYYTCTFAFQELNSKEDNNLSQQTVLMWSFPVFSVHRIFLAAVVG